MPLNRGWCLASECHGKEIQRQRKMLAQLLGWGNLWVFSKLFSWNCMEIWKLKSRCSSISCFFVSGSFPHVFPKDFYYNYYIIILSHGFFLKIFFRSVIFLRNFQGISQHFTGTLWIFQFGQRRQSHVRRCLFSSLATWVRHASRCEICAEFR